MFRATTHSDAAALGLLVLGLAVCHARVLFGAACYYAGDIALQYYPWHDYLRRMVLEQGNWTPWCPLVSCGYPLWAAGQSGVFYPPNLLFYLPLSVPYLYSIATFLQYLIAAAGMYLLCRSLARSRWASLGAALVFGFSGFMTAHLLHLTIISAAAWFPWVLYGGARYAAERKARWALLGAFSLACQWLAAHPQVVLYTVLTLFPFAWMAAATHPSRPLHGWRGGLRVLGQTGLVIITGTCLAGLQLVPLAQLAERAERTAERTFEFVTSHSLPPKHLITLAHPFWFGNPSAPGGEGGLAVLLEVLQRRVLGSSWFRIYGTWNPHELMLFMGVLPLGLVLALGTWGAERRRVRFLWGIALVSLLLAFGHHTPLYRVLWKVPVLNSFRVPARWVLVWSVMVAALFAFAVDHLGSAAGDSRALRRMILGSLGVAVLFGLVFLWAWFGPPLDLRMDSETVHWSVGSAARRNLWAPPLGLGLLALLLILRRKGKIRSERLKAAVVLLSAGELLAFAWAYNPVASPRIFTEPPPLVSFLRQLAPKGRIDSLLRKTAAAQGSFVAENEEGAKEIQRYLGIKGLGLAPNYNLLWSIPRADGYDPLAIYSIEDLSGRVPPAEPRLSALFGVELLVSTYSPEQLSPAWRSVGRVSGFWVYRNPRFAGLAWLSHQARPSGRLEADMRLPAAIDAFPSSVAYLDEPTPELSEEVQLTRPDRVEVRAWSEREIRVDCESEAPGILVISSTWYPGWTASLDDQAARLFVCNEAFCGVKMPSGRHEVRLSYHPAGLGTGLALTAVGVLLCGLTVAVPRLARRQPEEG